MQFQTLLVLRMGQFRGEKNLALGSQALGQQVANRREALHAIGGGHIPVASPHVGKGNGAYVAGHLQTATAPLAKLACASAF